MLSSRHSRDLKGNNILITRNGSNVKLIDFGLSETDDSIYAKADNLNKENARAKELIQKIYPHQYTVTRRILRALPFVLSVCLLALAAALFLAAYNERHDADIEQQHMLEILNAAWEKHQTDIRHAAIVAEKMPWDSFLVAYDLPDWFTFDSISRVVIATNPLIQSGWIIRDSLMNLYPDDEALRAQIFDIWTQKDLYLSNELLKIE